ncbi:MAG TPA: prepilin-type N-terminal cleavage/methylation domain-containing protein [Polyangiaceae bacterium]|nr:prepilin-type N-terminal cleavage/methylation domain-containing protein [Polyangiaceae bacterium]
MSGRSRARGYTITELLMSLSVLAIGVAGVIAMQRVTLAANRHARDIAVATRIGQAWADQLAADGMLWGVDANNASTLPNTVWLSKTTPSDVTGTWFLPAYSPARGFGPAFGPLGQSHDNALNPELDHFCTHLRLAFVEQEKTPTTGNGVIRAQVRVFWLRDDQAVAAPGTNVCVDATTLENNIGAFHVLNFTTSVRQLPAAKQVPP